MFAAFNNISPATVYSSIIVPRAQKIANLQHALTLMQWDHEVNISSNSEPSLFAARDGASSVVQQEVFREFHKTDLQRACLFLLSKPRSESQLSEVEYANTREMHRQIFRLTKIPRSVMFRRVHNQENIDTARVWQDCYSRREWGNPKLLEALRRDLDYATIAGDAMASSEMKNNLLAENNTSSTDVNTTVKQPPKRQLTAVDGWLMHQELNLTSERIENILGELKKFTPYALHMSKQQQEAFDDEDKLKNPDKERLDAVLLGEEKYRASLSTKSKRSAVENDFLSSLFKDLGFDFNRGRIDFSQSTNQMSYFRRSTTLAMSSSDVRVILSKSKLRTQEESFAGLISAVGEALGHALYEQNRPSSTGSSVIMDQPISLPRSTALSKSQALLFERHLLCRPSFMKFLITRRRNGSSSSSSSSVRDNNNNPELLSKRFRQLTRNYKGLNEMETLLKNCAFYEIEKSILLKQNTIEEVPKMWRQKSAQYHLVDGEINELFYEMQSLEGARDWATSMFGYAPMSILGSLYASFIFREIVNQVYGGSETSLDCDIEKGDFSKIQDFLRVKIWSQGSIPLNANELLKGVAGGAAEGDSKLTDAGLVKCYQDHVFKMMA